MFIEVLEVLEGVGVGVLVGVIVGVTDGLKVGTSLPSQQSQQLLHMVVKV